ncbi:unnamed protein product, partial [Mesorhabditis belari]|uniref:Uncharacterized protein n=1 Tax=Mesorhabditis belari TaxID=2138241 RepID=A0AAF3FCV9_9BILA
MLFATFFNLLYGIFVVVAFGFFEESTPMAQVIFSVLDMCFAWYPFMILLLSLWTVEEWRVHYEQLLYAFFGWKTPVHKRTHIKNIDPQSRSNIYFNYYKNDW